MVNIKDKGDPICALVNITQKKTKTMKKKKSIWFFEMKEDLSLHDENSSGKLMPNDQ